MLKKSLSVFIAALLINATICVNSVSADIKQEKQAQLIEKVKAGISRLGVGKVALIEVKLRDKTRLAGYISEASADHFVVTDLKTSDSTSVTYADVTQVRGHNLSTGAKIAIGVGIGVGIALIILAIYLNCCTG